MLTLSPTMLAAIALVSGAWLALAAWATVRGLGRGREAAVRIEATRHHEALLAASPALPLVVHRDGRLEEAERVALALGLADVAGPTVRPRRGVRRGGYGADRGPGGELRRRGREFRAVGPADRLGPGLSDPRRPRAALLSRPAPSSSGSTDATEGEEEMAELRERGPPGSPPRSTPCRG